MKKAIYFLIAGVLLSSCNTPDDSIYGTLPALQTANRDAIQAVKVQGDQYEWLISEQMLQHIFSQYGENATRNIQYVMIDSQPFIEAQTQSGTIYIELTSNGSDGILYLGTRLIRCSTRANACEDCRYSGGGICFCGYGANDCNYSASLLALPQ